MDELGERLVLPVCWIVRFMKRIAGTGMASGKDSISVNMTVLYNSIVTCWSSKIWMN
jgi:hypothetical protein